MPTKIDYLRDLRDNPQAITLEVQRRVKAVTVNAVETAFRKYADVGLVEFDKSVPRRYILTGKGVSELKKLESEAQTVSSVLGSASLSPQFDLGILVGQFAALAEQLQRTAPDSEERTPRLVQTATSDKDNLPWDDPRVQRLYGIELGLSDLPRRDVRQRRDSLAEIIGSEIADRIAQLVRCEAELCEAQEDSWWSDIKKSEILKREITELRGKIGFSAHVQSEEEAD